MPPGSAQRYRGQHAGAHVAILVRTAKSYVDGRTATTGGQYTTELPGQNNGGDGLCPAS